MMYCAVYLFSSQQWRIIALTRAVLVVCVFRAAVGVTLARLLGDVVRRAGWNSKAQQNLLQK